MILRSPESADLPAIVALLADDELGSRREDPSSPPSSRYTSAFAAPDAGPNQLLAVAENAGAIIGCLQITFIRGFTRTGMWRCLIEGVRIAKEERGSGIGREMFGGHQAVPRTRLRPRSAYNGQNSPGRPSVLGSARLCASHEEMELKL